MDVFTDTHDATAAAPSRNARKLLSGQKALVTGANSGIGRAVALPLGEAGADVAVNYVSGQQQADEVVNTIAAAGSAAVAIRADVSQEDQVERLFDRRSLRSGRSTSSSIMPACNAMLPSTA